MPVPAGSGNVFNVIAANRAACNTFLSTTTCAGGPHIDIYNQDDGSGRQRWRFSLATTAQTVPNGLYSVKSVGTAAEPNNAACGVYFGATACGGAATVRHRSNLGIKKMATPKKELAKHAFVPYEQSWKVPAVLGQFRGEDKSLASSAQKWLPTGRHLAVDNASSNYSTPLLNVAQPSG